MQPDSFGGWLKRRRKSLDLTQADLANRIGCSAAAIRKIEAEERRPSAQIAARLADLFNIPESERTAFVQFARGSWNPAPSGVPQDLPWLVSLPAARTNLPTPLTTFIGRANEVQEIVRLPSTNRLVTLTGPGGVGKTRLAIQSATQLLNEFKDGVWWVELAALTDEKLVPSALARSLGVVETPNQSVNETLADFLRSKQLLLVLDNCEHLIRGCAQIADRLLSACPDLRILATSREALGLPSEMLWSVPGLPLPSPQHELPSDLMQNDGIRLFVERASAIKSGFHLTERNALSVAQVCQRLDGIPLAIELAAARVKMMSVDEIAKRLNDRFNLLTAGSRAALPRHQTLRAAMDWSYDLLSEPERILYSQLSVFAGGFTLEAAIAVAVGGAVSRTHVLDLLGQLINKSLVIVVERTEKVDAETRYGMLETIREFAREKLAGSAETERVRQRHCDFFSSLAETAEPKLKGAQQLEWLDRLEIEHDNLRAALLWTQQVGDREATLRLAGALFWFWYRRGYLSEGRGWLKEKTNALEADVSPPIQASALWQAAYFARRQGDFTGALELVEQSIHLSQTLELQDKRILAYALALRGSLARDDGELAKARSLCEESVALFRERRDAWGLAWSLIGLGMVIRDQQEYALARSTIEESVLLWRELEDLWGLAEALHYLGLVAYRRGDYGQAYSLMEDALRFRQGLGDRISIAYCLHNMGVFLLAQGDPNRARHYFEQDLALLRELGDKSGIVLSLQYQGFYAQLEGHLVLAQSFFEQGLMLARETGPRWVSSNYLMWLGGTAARQRQFERAARLCGAAKANLERSASYWDAFERASYDRITSLASASLGAKTFALVEAEGYRMPLEQAVEYALHHFE